MLHLITNELQKSYKKKKFLIALIILLIVTIFACYTTYNDFQQGIPQKKLEYAQRYLNSLENERKSNETSDNKKKELNQKIEEQNYYINNLKNIINSEKSDWKEALEKDITQLNNEKNEIDSSKTGNIKEINLKIETDQYYIKHNINPNDEYNMNAVKSMPSVLSVLNILFLSFIVVMITVDAVSGEYFPPTIKMLLTKPISRGKILFSKFISSVISSISIVLFSDLIAFLGIGIIFKFGNILSPMTVGTKFENDPQKITQGFKGIIGIPGTSHISPFWETFIEMLIFQILFIIACVAFSIMISTLTKNNVISTGLGFLIMAVLTIINLRSILANSGELVKLTPLDKVLPFLFTTYSDGSMLVTGDITTRIGMAIVNPTTGIVVLLVWSILCYGLAHLVFINSDILA